MTEEQRQLERQMSRMLKRLPDLEAPATLMPRVLQAIAQRRLVPWYRTPWQNWPTPLRLCCLLVLISAFGGLCLASWQLTRAAGTAEVMRELGHTFAGVTVVYNVLNALLGAMVLVAKQLGTAFIFGCLAALGVGYALCVGLGTIYVRVALSRS